MTKRFLINFASKLDWMRNVERNPGMFGNLFPKKSRKLQRYVPKGVLPFKEACGDGNKKVLDTQYLGPILKTTKYLLFLWQKQTNN